MRRFLLIDADDTLWENNIYFERAFEEFCDFLDHSTLTNGQVRAALDEIELVNNRIHGYGSANFARNLVECYHRLAERQIAEADIERILALAEQIARQPIELLDGVVETLDYLHGRHNLTLFTKGHPEEQRLKLDRSGLEPCFHHTAIVKEKDVASYRRLVETFSIPPEECWMIGNSPKSDILPALEAGLWAVFVPHAHTWRLEAAALPEAHPKLVRTERFADLAQIF